MPALIWIVFIAGMIAAQWYGGRTGRLIFCALVLLAVTVFRRSLVLSLTRLSSRLGLTKSTIIRMPDTIQLTPAASPDGAANLIRASLTSAGFVDAGAWNIPPMPKIHVDLMVHPVHQLLAVMESFQPVGAQLNLHTLYPDGRVVTFTNTEMPPPKFNRPGVTRVRSPRSPADVLLAQALSQRPAGGFVGITPGTAPRIYEKLYAEEIRFRKSKGG